MGIRDFITNRALRKRLQAWQQQFDDIRPPRKPSRAYMTGVTDALLSEEFARFAHRELKLIGARAIPVLAAALHDPRFSGELERSDASTERPFERLLELLAPHAPSEVIAFAAPLGRSSSASLRKVAALYMASTGSEAASPFLAELLTDSDSYVRSFVVIGVTRAVEAGRCTAAFRDAMYGPLLSQCDQTWHLEVNDAANAVVALDPRRAAVDFGTDRWLSLSNGQVHRTLEACNVAGIRLPEAKLRRLLDETLALAVGAVSCVHGYAAAGAIEALAAVAGERAMPTVRPLLQSEREEIREAAAKAVGKIAGIDDPWGFVVDLRYDRGFEKLTEPQRVFYCGSNFDYEVCNGGLMQFLGNSSGDHAVETLAAIRVIGHAEAENALSTAMRLVGPLAREKDRDMRLAAIEDRFDELRAAFEPLEGGVLPDQGPLPRAPAALCGGERQALRWIAGSPACDTILAASTARRAGQSMCRGFDYPICYPIPFPLPDSRG